MRSGVFPVLQTDFPDVRGVVSNWLLLFGQQQPVPDLRMQMEALPTHPEVCMTAAAPFTPPWPPWQMGHVHQASSKLQATAWSRAWTFYTSGFYDPT